MCKFIWCTLHQDRNQGDVIGIIRSIRKYVNEHNNCCWSPWNDNKKSWKMDWENWNKDKGRKYPENCNTWDSENIKKVLETWGELTMPLWCLDAWMLGCLLQLDLNGKLSVYNQNWVIKDWNNNNNNNNNNNDFIICYKVCL